MQSGAGSDMLKFNDQVGSVSMQETGELRVSFMNHHFDLGLNEISYQIVAVSGGEEEDI
jgi:hypothetical protein